MEINSILDSTVSRLSFLMGLVFITKADGVIDPEEMAFFQNAAVAMELDEESLGKIQSCWQMECCPKLEFSSIAQQKFFLREAIELTSIDNNYAASEKALVRQFAADFGIPVSVVEALEEWAQEGIAWKKRGDDLICDTE